MGNAGGCSCGTLLCLLILAGAGGALAWYFTKGGGTFPTSAADLKNLLPDLSDFHQEEPFQGESPGQVPRWALDGSGGTGLSLEIRSALQDLWQPYFAQAVSDWDGGSPDVLTLTSSTTDYDPDCTPIDGLMKVCNADYGDTGWYGINEIAAVGKQIVSSVAKMNDFYFSSDGEYMADRRQYTMCHEMGHGFGLPHTDESFWNKDQGNCLDYTNTPANNLHPGQVNFDFLNDLYGDGSSTGGGTDDGGTGGATDDAAGGDMTTSSSTGGVADGAGGAQRQRQLSSLPDWVRAEWRQVSAEAQLAASAGAGAPSHWRLLQSDAHGEVHRVELGGGYAIVVRKLRPTWLA